MELVNKDQHYFASAKELYKELGIKRKYANWIKESVERAGLIEHSEFVTILSQSTGGRPSIEYLLTRDAALAIAMMSGGKFAKEVRQKLIELFKQHDKGLAFTAPQIESLMDLTKAMTLVSIQKNVEARHYNLYNDKYSWHQYRASILGYDTKTIIEAMKKVNKKHKSMRASLIILDANEIIRIGVIDLMMALGKSKEYAANVGNLCKKLSEKSEYGNIIWDDTKENPINLNEAEKKERKQLFNQSEQLLLK